MSAPKSSGATERFITLRHRNWLGSILFNRRSCATSKSGNNKRLPIIILRLYAFDAISGCLACSGKYAMESRILISQLCSRKYLLESRRFTTLASPDAGMTCSWSIRATVHSLLNSSVPSSVSSKCGTHCRRLSFTRPRCRASSLSWHRLPARRVLTTETDGRTCLRQLRSRIRFL